MTLRCTALNTSSVGACHQELTVRLKNPSKQVEPEAHHAVAPTEESQTRSDKAPDLQPSDNFFPLTPANRKTTKEHN